MADEKRVRDLMIPVEEYMTVDADGLVKEAVAVLSRGLEKPGCQRSVIVIGPNGAPVGLLTIRRLLKAVEPQLVDLPHSISWIIEDTASKLFPEGLFAERSKKQGEKKVREVMDSLNLITVEAEAPLLKAVHLMMRHNVGALPVLDAGRLVGMIRMEDIFHEIAGLFTAEDGG
ncbi:MAG: CBS domain-containing protein [Candidatus Desulforudis sp.]|nr:CBS domain-containing protein [Desulforudis sp.]